MTSNRYGELGIAPHLPSGTAYKQDGNAVASLGFFELWDNDICRQDSRNKDPKTGMGIELIYLPAE